MIETGEVIAAVMVCRRASQNGAAFDLTKAGRWLMLPRIVGPLSIGIYVRVAQIDRSIPRVIRVRISAMVGDSDTLESLIVAEVLVHAGASNLHHVEAIKEANGCIFAPDMRYDVEVFVDERPVLHDILATVFE